MTVWQIGLCREKVAEWDDIFFRRKGFQTVCKLIGHPERYYASYYPSNILVHYEADLRANFDCWDIMGDYWIGISQRDVVAG
jgi:hypothetical protein